MEGIAVGAEWEAHPGKLDVGGNAGVSHAVARFAAVVFWLRQQALEGFLLVGGDGGEERPMCGGLGFDLLSETSWRSGR
jgi:hypothetical protein